MSPTLTSGQAANLLQVDQQTVRAWIRSGKLAGGRISANRMVVSGQSVAHLLTEAGIPAGVSA